MNRLRSSLPAHRIRNFAIIAHVDHGKSTLADRLIEATGTVEARRMREQVLDSMDLERERGITIKLQTVRMFAEGPDGEVHQLHLIDTPGHVDFTGEVTRSLAAADGVLLLVDATQGVQAQTVANLRLANELGLAVLPVVNKIDSPLADVAAALDGLDALPGVDAAAAVLVSARTGEGVAELIEQIIAQLPPPSGDATAPLRAIVFDSHYDPFAGVVLHVRVVDGTLLAGQRMLAHSSGTSLVPAEVGVFAPAAQVTGALLAGEVGWVSAAMKDATLVRPGEILVDPEADPTGRRRSSGRPSRWSSPGSTRPGRATSRRCAARSNASP
ncbi:GTP-binding protein [Arenivirga flava]|uniref:Tr-type G domain-containing protein n=1 Tax=Arenivirga flava TaxID=1930060 RepID=A0AA37UCW2_9MICO|nr:GTP-binding protein [Arenivirga flava]GMA27715.1 hypothetical protein GCM10025874_09680 [Arenivirga flava]